MNEGPEMPNIVRVFSPFQESILLPIQESSVGSDPTYPIERNSSCSKTFS